MRHPVRLFAFCRLASLLLVLIPQAARADLVVFLGDSMLYGFDNYPDLKPNELVNFGASSTLSSYVASRAGEAASLKPSALFIETGINDITSDKDQTYFAANVNSALAAIEATSPSTRIYVNAIFPVNFADFPSPIQGNNLTINQTINAFNATLRSVTAKYANAVFLDPTARFVDDSGNLAADLSFDGMHLNRNGYALWADTLRPSF